MNTIMLELGLILLVCLAGEWIAALLPFAFPASVIGMLLLFLGLITGILKVAHIRDASDFLLTNMPFFFIPVNVSLINYLDLLKANWLPLLVICLVSTIITFAATTYAIKLTLWFLDKRRRSNP